LTSNIQLEHPDTPLVKDKIMPVSFARDILPLFRPVDIQHMRPRQVLLADYAYMSNAAGDNTFPDHANARNVYDYLSPQQSNPPRMPPGGPYWSTQQLQLFNQWVTDGFQP
jgi:hypothetical protein